MTQLDDGRPMETDIFLAKLIENCDCFEIEDAVRHWVEGAWGEAVDYLPRSAD